MVTLKRSEWVPGPCVPVPLTTSAAVLSGTEGRRLNCDCRRGLGKGRGRPGRGITWEGVWEGAEKGTVQRRGNASCKLNWRIVISLAIVWKRKEKTLN